MQTFLPLFFYARLINPLLDSCRDRLHNLTDASLHRPTGWSFNTHTPHSLPLLFFFVHPPPSLNPALTLLCGFVAVWSRQMPGLETAVVAYGYWLNPSTPPPYYFSLFILSTLPLLNPALTLLCSFVDVWSRQMPGLGTVVVAYGVANMSKVFLFFDRGCLCPGSTL